LLDASRRVRDEIYSAVKVELQDESRTYQTIAEANSISVATVQRIAGSLGISRPVGPRPRSSRQEPKTEPLCCGTFPMCASEPSDDSDLCWSGREDGSQTPIPGPRFSGAFCCHLAEERLVHILCLVSRILEMNAALRESSMADEAPQWIQSSN